jgi:hypothetical protein
MADHKKKGDFRRTSGQKDDVGGNKKSGAQPESDSRTASKQNAGHGGHK